MEGKGRIKVKKDGPYVVTGGVPLVKMVVVPDSDGRPLAWREVSRYPAREAYSLCRCGGSKIKPFCDGAHAKNGFDGTETATREPYLNNVKEFKGPELTLLDNKPLCIGAGFCDRAGGIWNLAVRSDDPEYKEITIEEAANCPSGRLVLLDKEGKLIEPPYEPSIVVVEDAEGYEGPLWVRGGVEIESCDGHVYETRNRVSLCQCGKSENKPLCDGSHFDE